MGRSCMRTKPDMTNGGSRPENWRDKLLLTPPCLVPQGLPSAPDLR
jgi:hypothetical protein